MANQAEKDLQMVIMLWGTVSGKRLVNHWWTIGPVNAAYGSLSHEFFFCKLLQHGMTLSLVALNFFERAGALLCSVLLMTN